MRNLLNINNYHYRRGGSDAVYLDHAAMMADLGWNNAYFAMKHPRNISTPWSKYFVDEIEYGERYGIAQKIGMASKIVYSFEARKKLQLLLDDFPADIVHLHCIYHHLSPSILSVLARANLPAIMTAHDLKIACPAYKMLNASGICERCRDGFGINVVRHRCIRGSVAASAVVWLESVVHKRLDSYRKYLHKIIVPSRFFARKFVEWGWPEDKFVYIPNFIDAQNITIALDNDDYFLYFGRLAQEKGVETLLRAASISGVKLKIVGTGPEEGHLKRVAVALGIDIQFLGYQSGEALERAIRGSKAVVLPSEWYENAPMSVLEAMARGKPVIGADIGGIPEIVDDGSNGWLFASGDVEELSDVLAHVSNLSTREIRQYAWSARNTVIDRFSKKSYQDSILRLYSQSTARV